LFPGFPGVDIGAAATMIREQSPAVDYFELSYAAAVSLLEG
jgi:hypothetical protein